MKKRIAFFLVAFLAVGVVDAGAQFWEKKEWKQWSKGDAQKMLEDSPWAKKWKMGEVLQLAFGQPTQGTGREDRPEMYYVVQLRSAQPIRQGVIRLAQIANNYAKMPDAQKQAFDHQGGAYIDKVYEDVVVVHVVYGSNVTMVERNMARLWQGFPEGVVPTDTYLTASNGKRVAPVRLISPPGGGYEFELIFPRLENNEPIIGPNDTHIRVEFPTPDLRALGGGADNTAIAATDPGNRPISTDTSSRQILERSRTRVFAEFKLDKMKFNGKLEY
jgi:hypothetical protein